MTIAHFIASEMVDVARLAMFVVVLAAARVVTVKSVVAIEAIVDVTPEAFASVIPRAGADEDAARKPLGPVVSIRRAVIGWVIEVAIWAHGRRADLDSDLRLRFLSERCEE